MFVITETACTDEEFSCLNDMCVPLALQCDGHDDCGDGSDEVGCGKRT